jgi:hypothetical protein
MKGEHGEVHSANEFRILSSLYSKHFLELGVQIAKVGHSVFAKGRPEAVVG